MSDIPALLERYRRGPELMAVVLTGVFGEEEDFSPAPGKWTARQIMAHLADAELVYAVRMRQVVAENNPPFLAFDQNLWAERLDYARRKPKQSLESFRRLRGEIHEFLKELPESAFERTGMHSKDGVLTLRQLVERLADHAESHARGLQNLREEYKRYKGKS
jgi:hypothetical protein